MFWSILHILYTTSYSNLYEQCDNKKRVCSIRYFQSLKGRCIYSALSHKQLHPNPIHLTIHSFLVQIASQKLNQPRDILEARQIPHRDPHYALPFAPNHTSAQRNSLVAVNRIRATIFLHPQLLIHLLGLIQVLSTRSRVAMTPRPHMHIRPRRIHLHRIIPDVTPVRAFQIHRQHAALHSGILQRVLSIDLHERHSVSTSHSRIESNV